MRNMIRAALVIGTLATPMIAAADAPKSADKAPAAKTDAKDSKDAKAPAADAKKDTAKDSKTPAKDAPAKDAKKPATK